MKPKSLIGLELQARFAAIVAWRIWGSQGGMMADEKRGRPLNRLAAKAKEIAAERSRLADLLQKLNRLFPLGYSSIWSLSPAERLAFRQGRKGVAA